MMLQTMQEGPYPLGDPLAMACMCTIRTLRMPLISCVSAGFRKAVYWYADDSAADGKLFNGGTYQLSSIGPCCVYFLNSTDNLQETIV